MYFYNLKQGVDYYTVFDNTVNCTESSSLLYIFENVYLKNENIYLI